MSAGSGTRGSFLRPTGPHGVGSIVRELVDRGRAAHLASNGGGRRLLVKVWYPAETRATGKPELLWQELRADPRTPLPMRLLLKCSRARTATLPRAAMSTAATASALVVYNHGLVSFAAENTSLMQELASHGYTVLAIQHLEQLEELKALSRGQPAEERRAADALARKIRAGSPEDKARLAEEYYRASVNTHRIVMERALDTSFVLDRVREVLAEIPGAAPNAIDGAAAHLVGFSVGGAVATETARRDARASSVVNLDGGAYGSPGAVATRLPYLMMYSAANDGINDRLLPAHAVRLAPPETTHLNYHDIAGLLPVMRYLGMTGRTHAAAFLAYRNRAVREFIAGSPSSPLEPRGA